MSYVLYVSSSLCRVRAEAERLSDQGPFGFRARAGDVMSLLGEDVAVSVADDFLVWLSGTVALHNDDRRDVEVHVDQLPERITYDPSRRFAPEWLCVRVVDLAGPGAQCLCARVLADETDVGIFSSLPTTNELPVCV
jgi:hypothetical protein